MSYPGNSRHNSPAKSPMRAPPGTCRVRLPRGTRASLQRRERGPRDSCKVERVLTRMNSNPIAYRGNGSKNCAPISSIELHSSNEKLFGLARATVPILPPGAVVLTFGAPQDLAEAITPSLQRACRLLLDWPSALSPQAHLQKKMSSISMA